jgi:hypothetical protein
LGWMPYIFRPNVGRERACHFSIPGFRYTGRASHGLRRNSTMLRTGQTVSSIPQDFWDALVTEGLTRRRIRSILGMRGTVINGFDRWRVPSVKGRPGRLGAWANDPCSRKRGSHTYGSTLYQLLPNHRVAHRGL